MEAKRDRGIIAIILMAGSGRRMRITEKKQFLPFHGKPLFCASVESFLSWGRCGEILLVINEEDRCFVESVVEKEGWRNKTELHLVEGGAERFLSVYQALQFLKKKSEEGILFIHDAARPFFTEDLLERLLEKSRSASAVIPGVAVKDTIKRVEGGVVQESLKRTGLYAVQTPQVFLFSLLYEAYQDFFVQREKREILITDDAMLIEAFSEEQVYLISGEEQNRKITVKEDLSFLSE
jgi:2-C-methyl-D-erythritol 4-phosphate cytidylyltransferase